MLSVIAIVFTFRFIFGDFGQDNKRIIFINYLYSHDQVTKKYLDEKYIESMGNNYSYIDNYDYYFISKYLKTRDVENLVLKKFKIKNLNQLKPHVTNAFKYFDWGGSDIIKYTEVGLALDIKGFLDSDGFISNAEKSILDNILLSIETNEQWIYTAIFDTYKHDVKIQSIANLSFEKYEYISQKHSNNIVKIIAKKLKAKEWDVYKYFTKESEYSLDYMNAQIKKLNNIKINRLVNSYKKDNLFSIYEKEMVDKAIDEYKLYLIYESKAEEYAQVAAKFAIEHKYIGYKNIILELNNHDYIRYRFKENLNKIFVKNHHPFYKSRNLSELERHFKHDADEYNWDYRVYTKNCDILLPLFEDAIKDGIYNGIESDEISTIYYNNCYYKS